MSTEIQEMPEQQAQRQRIDSHLRAMRCRKMLKDNEYAQPEPNPVGERETKIRFMYDHPTLSNEGKQEAFTNVDDQKRAEFIEKGYYTNEWPKYDKAGQHAEEQDYLRQRNQED